ncbi:MAG: glycerophosphodiester phosphodiesterase, partial [bacterium]|nr:glycerophosphodiester phosphodiesterase [bacterium]
SGMRERTVVQCFNLDLIKEIRKINPGLTTSALFTLTRVEGLLLLAGFDSKRDEIIKKTIALKSEIISPHYIYVTPEFIKKCHDNNIAVIPWTVNKKEKMVELLRMGVDGIISDNPVRLYKVYSEWKKMK